MESNFKIVYGTQCLLCVVTPVGKYGRTLNTTKSLVGPMEVLEKLISMSDGGDDFMDMWLHSSISFCYGPPLCIALAWIFVNLLIPVIFFVYRPGFI
jgi:hypothetical protein